MLQCNEFVGDCTEWKEIIRCNLINLKINEWSSSKYFTNLLNKSQSKIEQQTLVISTKNLQLHVT